MHHDLDLFVFHLVVPPKKNDKPDKQLVDVQPMEASNRPRKGAYTRYPKYKHDSGFP